MVVEGVLSVVTVVGVVVSVGSRWLMSDGCRREMVTCDIYDGRGAPAAHSSLRVVVVLVGESALL